MHNALEHAVTKNVTRFELRSVAAMTIATLYELRAVGALKAVDQKVGRTGGGE